MVSKRNKHQKLLIYVTTKKFVNITVQCECIALINTNEEIQKTFLAHSLILRPQRCSEGGARGGPKGAKGGRRQDGQEGEEGQEAQKGQGAGPGSAVQAACRPQRPGGGAGLLSLQPPRMTQ